MRRGLSIITLEHSCGLYGNRIFDPTQLAPKCTGEKHFYDYFANIFNGKLVHGKKNWVQNKTQYSNLNFFFIIWMCNAQQCKEKISLQPTKDPLQSIIISKSP